jgi:chemotaxis protein MotB
MTTEAPAEKEELTVEHDDHEDEGEEDNSGWLMTYGDMMTLLLTFFVLLFAMSETRMEDFAQLVESLKVAIGKQEVPEAGTREGLTMLDREADPEPKAVDELGALVNKELQSIKSEVEEFIFKNKLAGKVKVNLDGRGAVITISDVVLFPPGKTDINPDGKDILLAIKDLLQQFDYHIKVEGHTDNVPIHTERFPSNWELSANRASKIIRFFIENGIPPEQLSAEGFAEYRPVASNDTPEGRAQNRRVEIVYERGSVEKRMMKVVLSEKEQQTLLEK